MRLALTVTALIGAGALAAETASHPALRDLIPLSDVFAAGGQAPQFDVAGIRYAGLYAAQQRWAHAGVQGPSQTQIENVEYFLTAAEQVRLAAGLDLVAAQETTRADVLRVIDLYTAHFAANTGHPWRNDGAITSDMAYCDALGRR